MWPRITVRGFAFVHKTLAFATGAAVAGVGFMVLNDQILFSVCFVSLVVTV